MAPQDVSWFRVDTRLWVLNLDRAFGGTVDQQPGGFVATDGRGHRLGMFQSLRSAQDHVIAHA